MVGTGDEDGIEEPAFFLTRDAPEMKQEDGLGKRRSLHQGADIVSLDPYVFVICV